MNNYVINSFIFALLVLLLSSAATADSYENCLWGYCAEDFNAGIQLDCVTDRGNDIANASGLKFCSGILERLEDCCEQHCRSETEEVEFIEILDEEGEIIGLWPVEKLDPSKFVRDDKPVIIIRHPKALFIEPFLEGTFDP